MNGYYYDWLIYIGIIFFIVYSAMSVSYYNKIAKERMKNGPAFCVHDHDIDEESISLYQMVGLSLLAISVVVFVLKLNHGVFSKCNYQEGSAKGVVNSIATNTQYWWGLLILVIYGLTIYELHTMDKLKKCKEDVTKTGPLLIINAVVVGIISLMILIFMYRTFIQKKPTDIIGDPPESIVPSFETSGDVDIYGGSDDPVFN